MSSTTASFLCDLARLCKSVTTMFLVYQQMGPQCLCLFTGGTIMSSRESEFVTDLQKLSKQPQFNSISFETIIDKVRAHAAEV